MQATTRLYLAKLSSRALRGKASGSRRRLQHLMRLSCKGTPFSLVRKGVSASYGRAIVGGHRP